NQLLGFGSVHDEVARHEHWIVARVAQVPDKERLLQRVGLNPVDAVPLHSATSEETSDAGGEDNTSECAKRHEAILVACPVSRSMLRFRHRASPVPAQNLKVRRLSAIADLKTALSQPH